MKNHGYTRSALRKDLPALLGGGMLFGMAYNLFLSPGEVIVGGFTGIATLLHLLFSWNSGLLILLLNLPLLLWNALVYGLPFCVRAFLGIIITSLSVEYLTFFPISLSDPLLCAVLGGSVLGIGCGILLVRGFTTGGSDLIVWLIKKRRPQLSAGRLILAVDTVIVLTSTLVLRNWQTLFYALIAIFCFSHALDTVTGGAQKAKLAMIFSDRSNAISHALLVDLNRGVTVLSAKGAFTDCQRELLLCVVRPGEAFALKRTVQAIDPHAFFLFGAVDQVVGKGFDAPVLG